MIFQHKRFGWYNILPLVLILLLGPPRSALMEILRKHVCTYQKLVIIVLIYCTGSHGTITRLLEAIQ
jgi:hypothetical protein